MIFLFCSFPFFIFVSFGYLCVLFFFFNYDGHLGHSLPDGDYEPSGTPFSYCSCSPLFVLYDAPFFIFHFSFIPPLLSFFFSLFSFSVIFFLFFLFSLVLFLIFRERLGVLTATDILGTSSPTAPSPLDCATAWTVSPCGSGPRRRRRLLLLLLLLMQKTLDRSLVDACLMYLDLWLGV